MRALAALLCLSAGACAFGPQLHGVAVNHNDIVANSNNELVLVNILRARDREPLHFTSVSKLIGDAQISGAAGINVQARGATPTTKTNAAGDITEVSSLAGTDITTPSAQLTIGGKSSMDVSVWDNQEFYQGLIASIPASTVAHYLHQGWPSDLLTNLFVGSVDFVASDASAGYKKGALVETFINDPDRSDPYGRTFATFIDCYRLTSVPKAGTDTPLIALADLKEKLALADVAVLDGEKFDVTPSKDEHGQPQERWIARKGRTSDSLALRSINADDGEGPPCTGQKFTAAAPGSGGFEGQADEHSVIASGTYVKDGRTIPVQVQVVLRSIDGVIYYLGEYLRSRSPGTLIADAGAVPVINVTRIRPRSVFVTTEYKGQRYYVPATDFGRITPESGRSSQVFALVQQLLNLQKSAKDRPTTQTVRVVN